MYFVTILNSVFSQTYVTVRSCSSWPNFHMRSLLVGSVVIKLKFASIWPIVHPILEINIYVTNVPVNIVIRVNDKLATGVFLQPVFSDCRVVLRVVPVEEFHWVRSTAYDFVIAKATVVFL